MEDFKRRHLIAFAVLAGCQFSALATSVARPRTLEERIGPGSGTSAIVLARIDGIVSLSAKGAPHLTRQASGRTFESSLFYEAVVEEVLFLRNLPTGNAFPPPSGPMLYWLAGRTSTFPFYAPQYTDFVGTKALLLIGPLASSIAPHLADGRPVFRAGADLDDLPIPIDQLALIKQIARANGYVTP